MTDPTKLNRQRTQPAVVEPREPTWLDQLIQPRSLVFATLVLAAGVGGGSRLYRGWKARRAANRLAEADVTPGEVEASAQFARSILPDLYPLLEPSTRPEIRTAAAHALGLLWQRDELVAEEEKGVALRVHQINWRSRRRYPRALRGPIPIEVSLQLTGLDVPNLSWSYRIRGARRASLETPSPWSPIGEQAAPVRFDLLPDDFSGPGPHEIVIEPRLRHSTASGDGWELDLPHARHTIEFDPLLQIDALKALPDTTRAAAIAARLEPLPAEPGRFVPLNEAYALPGPLGLSLAEADIPCQLAHRVQVELEQIEGRYELGALVAAASPARYEFDALAPIPSDALTGPKATRLRYHLIPDPELGWADPDIRSLWPEPIVTDWRPIQIVRR